MKIKVSPSTCPVDNASLQSPHYLCIHGKVIKHYKSIKSIKVIKVIKVIKAIKTIKAIKVIHDDGVVTLHRNRWSQAVGNSNRGVRYSEAPPRTAIQEQPMTTESSHCIVTDGRRPSETGTPATDLREVALPLS